MLTLRAYGLMMIVPALLIAAALAPILTPVALAYGVGLAALVWLDRYNAGKVDQFRISRQHDAKLSLGVANPINLQLENLNRSITES